MVDDPNRSRIPPASSLTNASTAQARFAISSRSIRTVSTGWLSSASGSTSARKNHGLVRCSPPTARGSAVSVTPNRFQPSSASPVGPNSKVRPNTSVTWKRATRVRLATGRRTGRTNLLTGRRAHGGARRARPALGLYRRRLRRPRGRGQRLQGGGIKAGQHLSAHFAGTAGLSGGTGIGARGDGDAEPAESGERLRDRGRSHLARPGVLQRGQAALKISGSRDDGVEPGGHAPMQIVEVGARPAVGLTRVQVRGEQGRAGGQHGTRASALRTRPSMVAATMASLADAASSHVPRRQPPTRRQILKRTLSRGQYRLESHLAGTGPTGVSPAHQDLAVSAEIRGPCHLGPSP